MLSPIQPGFIKGNITNINNSSENIIGIFEVASVSHIDRKFFSFEDFYDHDAERFYDIECEIYSLDETYPSTILTMIECTQQGNVCYY
ncbi:hypothetical protein NBRC110019_30870 [Neptunitalea chrysea]|uniref:Uncharacterized protein n=1 Tax=Neptunitalea chrysea TaxID=1647581 RepID=A0A9W6B709_9FLAO|nr:hypothetical protein [Neptunitalea chrysea]GLB54046.1 hypothetical protein NBRC110019_30870 [Neptunitalea chrysea]